VYIINKQKLKNIFNRKQTDARRKQVDKWTEAACINTLYWCNSVPKIYDASGLNELHKLTQNM